jgi:hypothetical protein
VRLLVFDNRELAAELAPEPGREGPFRPAPAEQDRQGRMRVFYYAGP